MKHDYHKLSFRTLILLLSILFSTRQAGAADSLLIGYYESPPFIIKNEGKLEGINIYLWDQIRKELPVGYSMVEIPLDSLLSGLASGEIDVGITPLTITSERGKQFDFTPPFYIASSAVMVSSVAPFQKALQFASSFFSLNFLRVLISLVIVIFVFGFFVWIFERKKNEEEFGTGIKGIWNGIWWSAVTMTTVGYGDKSPKTPGGRLVALVWMFTAILLISGFTASIASSLTVNRLSWNMNSIADFKEKGIGTVQASATENWLEKNFYRDVAPYNSLPETIEGLGKGEIDAVAYDKPLLQYHVNSDTANNYEILPVLFNSQLYAFGLSEKLAPEIKELISNQLLEITESTDWDILLSEYGLHEN